MSVTTIKTTAAPRRVGSWVLQGIVATAFFAAGAAKLAGVSSIAMWAIVIVFGRFIAYNWFAPL